MKKLKVSREKAEELFANGDSVKKTLLAYLWPEVFVTDPYVKACRVLGINPEAPLEDRSDRDKVAADAFYRLTICIRAKNLVDGKVWEPVYDGTETHYWPYFKKDAAGFGFSDADYGDWSAYATVGSRLEYRTRELAIEGANEFIQLYNDFIKL